MKHAAHARLAALVTLAALAGCSTTPLPLHELRDPPAERVRWVQPANATATVVVARDAGFTASATVVRVSVDGKPAGELLPAERLVLRVAPGPRTVTAMVTFMGGDVRRRPNEVTVTAAADAPVLVRMGFDGGDAAGFWLWQDREGR